MNKVAQRAISKGLVDEVKVSSADADSFANAMQFVDKDNLIIAKGMLETPDFLRLIIKYNNKELIYKGSDGFLSHCTVLEKKRLFRPTDRVIVTDAAINIVPSIEQKLKIAQNALDFAHQAGIKRPVLSILTSSGKYNPAMEESVDGDYLIKNLKGDDFEVRLDQMDTAIDVESRKAKNLDEKTADILLADRLTLGNAIYKCYTKIGGYRAAGIVCGTTLHVVLNSRGDSARSKLFSIQYAVQMLKQKHN